MNCHEDSHSLRQCRHPFINASGCLNPDLGQVGDDGEAYRRWQARMNRCRRQDKSSRSNKQSNNQNRRRRGNSRGQPQSQGQASTQNDGFNTHAANGNQQSGSGHHSGVPRSPAYSAVGPSPGCPVWCISQPRRKPQRAPARHLPHWQLTSRRRYGTPRASAASIAGGKHINFTR